MQDPINIKSSIIELPCAVITFRKEGYIDIHYKNCYLTLEESKTIFRVIRKNSPWERCPVLVSQHQEATQEKEAREFISSETVRKHCTAIAFVVSNLAQKLVFNFYTRLFQPNLPAKCFSNANSAAEWLQLFTSHNQSAL